MRRIVLAGLFAWVVGGSAGSAQVLSRYPSPDYSEPRDEPMGGRTAAGSPVDRHTVDDYPAERRDVFHGMDQRYNAAGELVPLALNADEIKGRNTWLLWCGGNEAFWSWLQQYGYGFTDFLKVVDSRNRAARTIPDFINPTTGKKAPRELKSRFAQSGLINQPGMAPRADGGEGYWGLYLDEVVEPLAYTGGKNYEGAEYQPSQPDDKGRVLRSDGVNPAIYGYPSGVVGIRLFPNPDFDDKAKARWKSDSSYNDPSYYLDPQLVRPLRVGMSCGVCHVGPSPLNPPADPERPRWENLSSNIGAQYLKPQEVFGNLLQPENLIYHYLRSQQPGTIDTSLTATDNINNANTMNAVFGMLARLERAKTNQPERQSAENLLMPSVEDGVGGLSPRHTPRVLLDGSDSIGAFGALARVYLNIGTFYEEWNRTQNPIVGFRPQRPFRIAVAESNSVFWQVTEKYRTGYLKAFFTHGPSTAPMKLADIARSHDAVNGPAARAALQPGSAELVSAGRRVFIEHCALCHSSKQPANFELAFAARPPGGGEWRDAKRPLAAVTAPPLRTAPPTPPAASDATPPPTTSGPGAAGGSGEAQAGAPPSAVVVATLPAGEPEPGWPLTLPSDFADWAAFKESPAYRSYRRQIGRLAGAAPVAGAEDRFLADNFLANEVRIPVTLVGTNSARAAATNGMRGRVWDNFTSEDYKSLHAVGAIRTYNPYDDKIRARDSEGNNDSYAPPGGGPGYYRPASLISLWATGPYLHNNALGQFTGDPSVAGRVAVFEDGIRKLLWRSRREATPNGVVAGGAVAGATGQAEAWNRDDLRTDPGWVYRIPQDTDLVFPRRFIRPLVASIIGPKLLIAAELALVLLAVVLALAGVLTDSKLPPHLPGLVLLVLGAVTAYVFYGMGFGAITPFPAWAVPAFLFVAGTAFVLWIRSVVVARWLHWGSAVLVLVIAAGLHAYLAGWIGDLKVGPFPKGTPISLILNFNPEAPATARIEALTAAYRGMREAKRLQATPGAKETPREAFERIAGAALVRASKAPDYVLDRGHLFGDTPDISDEDKEALIAFLRTL